MTKHNIADLMLDCGCQCCDECAGIGHINDGPGKVIECTFCSGRGLVKLCRGHAEENGWVGDKILNKNKWSENGK